MKSILTIVIILSFAATAVFGFVFMNHGAMAHSGCVANIAAAAKGSPCPTASGSLDFALFHLDTWKSFSLAAFGENILATFLLVLILAAGFVVLRFLAPNAKKCPGTGAFCQIFLSPSARLIQWLALHENSPAAF